MIIASFSPALPAQAQEDPFPLSDEDSDGLANDLETAGWYNLAGGPFITDPNDLDSDNDGLTDGEEKLFDTNPLDVHNPGIAVRYDRQFQDHCSTSAPQTRLICRSSRAATST